jgi:hypothetical protein
VDPILGDYLGNDPNNLRGKGGVFNSRTLGLYSYTYNNPVVYIDPDGREGEFVAFWGVWAVATADAITPDPSDAAAPVKGAGYTGALIGTAIGGTLAYGWNLAFSESHEGTDTNTQTQTTTTTQSRENDGTVIYRWGSGSNTNLTPREKDRAGLSFSTQKPTSGKYTATTMEAINATGILAAVKDGPGHVSVMPTDPSKMQEWIDSRPSAQTNPHPLTETLKSVVVKE